MVTTDLNRDEMKQASRMIRRKKVRLFLFVLPLLLFILFTFVLPIGTMLYRSFYNPTVANLIPTTLHALASWESDGTTLPPEKILNTFATELRSLSKERRSGKLAEQFNRIQPGMSSVVKSSARKLRKKPENEVQATGGAFLLSYKKQWNQVDLWRGIQRAGSPVTDTYYLAAMDLQRSLDGEIEQRDGAQIYLKLYGKTLKIALIITIATALLAYPLAYYMAMQSERQAGVLLVFVLLPFWTSLLVRTTSWIALLQTNGVINSLLLYIHAITEPLELLYTQFSTVLSMTHILLPFMILPIYSVMKGIDPSYMRAAMSMGDHPLRAFWKVYLPMTLPGLSAGALLVFIISVGYYITPALVGGTDGQMISNIIAFHMQNSNNWELAAALGSLLLIVIIALYWTYDRLVGANNIKLG